MKLAGVLGLGLARAGSVFEAIVASGSTLLNDLVSYWTLDEQSGTRVDSVGDNDLTDNNTVLAVNRGPVGTSASFIGANSEALSLATAPDLGSNDHDYSVSVWIKPSSVSGENAVVALPYHTEIRGLVYLNNDSLLHIHRGGGVTWSQALVAGNWYHIVAWYDAAASKVYLSVNGGAAEEAAAADSEAPASSPFCVGAYAAYNAGLFDGQIGELGLWSRVLTAGERTSLLAGGNGKSYADLTAAEKVGLVSYWDLSEVSGTRVDAHGDNDLTDNNTVGSVNTGPLGTVATFVAASSEKLTGTGWNIPADTGGTISLWVNMGTGNGGILTMDDVSDRSWSFDRGGDTTVTFTIFDSVTSNSGIAKTITTGVWHHFLAWYDPADKKAYWSLDGAAAEAGAALANGPKQGSTPLVFGSFGASYYYGGLIGAAGTWSRVLTAGERTSLFASGLGKRYADLTAAEKVGLVSYWNLDEASGDRVDAHGDNDLTDNNTVLSIINAPPALDGAAASFVAANTEYLSRTDASIIDGGSDFTVNLWIKANNVTGGKGVIGKWNTDGWMVYLNGGTLRLYNGASNFNGDTISASQWYMITAWVSGTDGYIAVNNGTPVTADFTSLTPAAGTIPFNIGNYSSGGELWDGQIDEPAIWNRVLTADERAELFALGKGKFYDFS